MRTKLVLLIIGLGVIWGISSPIGAAAFYSWITLFRPQDFVYTPVNNIAPLSFAVLAISFLLGCLRGIIKPKWNKGTSYLILILIVTLISAFASPTSQWALKTFVKILKIIMPAVLISMIIQNEKDFKLLIKTFAVSIGIWAVQAGLYGAMKGGPVESMSIGGQMSDRNDFAIGVLMTLPLLYYLGMNEHRKIVKWMLFAASFMTCACVIVSNSRGAMLGLFFILLLNFTRKGTKRWRNIFIMLIGIPLFINFIPKFAIERLHTIKLGREQTEGSARSRMILMKSGIRGGLANPALGVGPGCWKLRATEYIPGGHAMGDGAYEPHCIWAKMMAELGFTGLFVYVLMFSSIIMSLRKIQKQCLKIKRTDYYNFAYMLQMSILAYCISATFVNQIYFEYIFLVIAVSGAFIKSWQTYMEQSENMEQSEKTASGR